MGHVWSWLWFLYLSVGVDHSGHHMWSAGPCRWQRCWSPWELHTPGTAWGWRRHSGEVSLQGEVTAPADRHHPHRLVLAALLWREIVSISSKEIPWIKDQDTGNNPLHIMLCNNNTARRWLLFLFYTLWTTSKHIFLKQSGREGRGLLCTWFPHEHIFHLKTKCASPIKGNNYVIELFGQSI